ncbi:hypothetical protein HPP92_007324 [Vanilla planifolia]|uniref:Uncharacterized protein n=1 Tax=Vanilla planifolia TaxID=51239 RepID=A0A835RDW4_VANPL|nr:hypothetical protein HPP92_007324 [Vanilla planifolia]
MTPTKQSHGVLQVQRPTPPQFIFLVNPLKETKQTPQEKFLIHRLKREESTRRSLSLFPLFVFHSNTSCPFNCWRNINGGDWVLLDFMWVGVAMKMAGVNAHDRLFKPILAPFGVFSYENPRRKPRIV